MFAARDSNCELRVAVERLGEDGMALYYELRNQSPRTVFVFDGVTPKSAPFYVERTGNTLTVSQRILAPPSGLEVERLEIPLASRVEPSQRLRRKLEIKLPLREAAPYPNLRPKRERGGEYLLIETHFEVGYFVAPAPELAREAGSGWLLPGLTPEMQSILRAGPIGRVAFDPMRR